jgi:hypothetical protein
MYEDIKWIANAFRIKCSKYTKEELTLELRDKLFDEAFNEYSTMENINSKLAEGSEE